MFHCVNRTLWGFIHNILWVKIHKERTNDTAGCKLIRVQGTLGTPHLKLVIALSELFGFTTTVLLCQFLPNVPPKVACMSFELTQTETLRLLHYIPVSDNVIRSMGTPCLCLAWFVLVTKPTVTSSKSIYIVCDLSMEQPRIIACRFIWEKESKHPWIHGSM